ncbi:MAG: type II secretion system F family protein [Proteobacteria bacterium]|jgi:type IV pilus assembly protein PilC|nr:type II secretion system F family protein [Alphaproteobacteria bacterium]NCC03738.1 type II secretion system F family protein [Pseudomonadota bacterium]
MPAYAYRATSQEGKIQKGLAQAEHETALALALKKSGLELIEAKVKTKAYISLRPTTRSGGTLEPQIKLCHQLATMLKAHVPLTEALRLAAEGLSPPLFQKAIQEIVKDIEGGTPVTPAFAHHASLFDPVFLALLETGEATGSLAEAFSRLHEHLQWQEEMMRRLRHALRYPLFLLALAMGVVGFMMLFVLPQLIDFLSSFDKELPLITRILIAGAQLFGLLWWLLPTLLALMIILIPWQRRRSVRFASYTDALALRLPGFGAVLRALALARMAACLSLLVKGGVDIRRSIERSGKTTANRFLQDMAGQAAQRVIQGYPLSQALDRLFPPFVLQMLKVGEKSGTLGEVLDSTAKALDQEARETVRSFLGILEPALTLCVGAIMAWIVLAVLGPVYGLLTPLSQGM